MNLIFFYGPPASGKLTIATELAGMTGYKLFHNHLSQDLVGSIYPELGSLRYALVEKLRLDVFEYAAQHNTDLIFTQFYTGDQDDKQFIKSTLDIVGQNGGRVYFVEVTAPFEVLKERVTNESRKKFGKAHDVDTLNRYLTTLKENVLIDSENKIVIESSRQPAAVSARLIRETFDLR